jgi:hypothetical protein
LIGLKIGDLQVKDSLTLHLLCTDHITSGSELKYLVAEKAFVGGTSETCRVMALGGSFME